MTTFECKPCGGSYEADTRPLAEAANWTADDFGRLVDALSEHIAAHPDSLRTQGGPEPARKRDWVGCRCKGACHCPQRRRS